MSELVDTTDRVEMIGPMATDIVDQRQLAEQLLVQAEGQNIELVGPGGLLNQLAKSVLETALDAEMVEHLGYVWGMRSMILLGITAGTRVTGRAQRRC